MSVAELFRQARESKGLSQAALAAAAKVSESTIIRMEGGRLLPLAPSLFAIADVLEVPASDVRAAVVDNT